MRQLSLLVAVLGACTGVPDGKPDSGADSGGDSGADSGSDSGADSGSDSGADSGSDSGADSGSDSGVDSGSDSSANADPVATFLAPGEGSTWTEADVVTVTLLVEDDHDPAEALTLSWSSVPDGGSPPRTAAADGTATFTLADLAPGDYAIGVAVSDTEGGWAAARVRFVVLHPDLDEDGYGTDVDCDDGDPTIHPGADERCNGSDDDCDGEVDERPAVDAPLWYADTDGDGYGDAASPTAACAAPAGYVGDATDCDDADGAVHPGADERCRDGLDNDCDGQTDDPSAVDARPFHPDADGDGYGDTATTTVACVPPPGAVTDGTDCDDTDAAVHPGATEECNGIDDDCDGAAVEWDVPGTYATLDEAVDAASGGEAICLAAGTHSLDTGTYRGAVDFEDKGITVQGQGRGVTYLDVGSRVVLLTSGMLADVTITGSDGSWSAVRCYPSSSATQLRRVTFEGNECTGGDCFPLLWVWGCTLTYEDLAFTDNVWSATEGYLTTLVEASMATIDGDAISFERNTVTSVTTSVNLLAAYPGYYDFGRITATDNVLRTEASTDGGLVALWGPQFQVSEATFVGNTVEAGGAINGGLLYIWPTAPADITHLTMTDNVVTSTSTDPSDVVDGGLISVYDYGATAQYVDIRRNRVSGEYVRGGLVNLYGDGELSLDNAIFAGNEVEVGQRAEGGLFYAGLRGEVDLGAEGFLAYADVAYNVVTGGEVYGGVFCGDYEGRGELASSGWDVDQVNIVGNDVTGDVYGSIFYDDSATYSYRTDFDYSNWYGYDGTPFENHPDPSGTSGNVSVDPDYTDVTSADPREWDLTLAPGSPVEDAGPADRASFDVDGTQSGIGAYAGPNGGGW